MKLMKWAAGSVCSAPHKLPEMLSPRRWSVHYLQLLSPHPNPPVAAQGLLSTSWGLLFAAPALSVQEPLCLFLGLLALGVPVTIMSSFNKIPHVSHKPVKTVQKEICVYGLKMTTFKNALKGSDSRNSR